MYKFENLIVWEKAILVAKEIYSLSSLLPKEENFGLKDQIRRAVTSICLNIAEGCGAESNQEFRRFLYLSRKSLYEVVATLILIEKLYPNINIHETRDRVDEVGKILNGLIKKVSMEC